MSITPLSAARIAGEVGLAGGTATGGAYAVKYSQQVTAVTGERDKAIADKKPAEDKNANLNNIYTEINSYWTQIKERYKGEYAEDMCKAIEKMAEELGVKYIGDSSDDSSDEGCTKNK